MGLRVQLAQKFGQDPRLGDIEDKIHAIIPLYRDGHASMGAFGKYSCEVFAKGDLKKEGPRDAIDITADEFKKWVVARWPVAPERRMKEYDHPAMFPEELVRRALKLFSYEGDVVLDPFNGTGTTCVVAKKLNRVYLGIDISEKYCAIAERRLGEIL
jgi:DNA modification methylase